MAIPDSLKSAKDPITPARPRPAGPPSLVSASPGAIPWPSRNKEERGEAHRWVGSQETWAEEWELDEAPNTWGLHSA
jgi:hypothetical protein